MESKLEKAIFAAGCFWSVEDAYRKVKGVKNVVSGYTGGHTKNPAHEEVCAGKTGHAESVVITFDPKEVSYKELLNVFWSIHDPTTINRQGADVGDQYRSVIFFLNDDQEKAAKESKEGIGRSGKFNNPIVTAITKATIFYKAEEYHQRYFERKGGDVCHT